MGGFLKLLCDKGKGLTAAPDWFSSSFRFFTAFGDVTWMLRRLLASPNTRFCGFNCFSGIVTLRTRRYDNCQGSHKINSCVEEALNCCAWMGARKEDAFKGRGLNGFWRRDFHRVPAVLGAPHAMTKHASANFEMHEISRRRQSVFSNCALYLYSYQVQRLRTLIYASIFTRDGLMKTMKSLFTAVSQTYS